MMGSKVEGNDLETASNEMIQLPFQLTKKVMELKQALNAYESFTGKIKKIYKIQEERPLIIIKIKSNRILSHRVFLLQMMMSTLQKGK